jgi:uncharacterized protein
VSTYYLDTSAALKLLVEEDHSRAFAEFYDDHATDAWVTSTLLRVELLRAVSRALPESILDARELLLAFAFVAIDDEIIEAAASVPDRRLRSLAAIHLATARTLGDDLDGLVSYDERLAAAAQRAGIETLAPLD